MAFIYNKKEIVWKIIYQTEWPLSRLTLIEVTPDRIDTHIRYKRHEDGNRRTYVKRRGHTKDIHTQRETY